nr:hypothetical protein [Piscirickettsia salmonis]
MSFFERYHTIIDDVDAFLNTLATPLPLCLWSNDLRINSNDFAALLDGEHIHYQRIPWTSNGFRILNSTDNGAALELYRGSLPYSRGSLHAACIYPQASSARSHT